jgi:hypothetical protein
LIAGSALAAETFVASRRGAASGAAAGFTGLVTGQLLYALACAQPTGEHGGAVLPGALAASFAVQGAALFVPGLRDLAGARLGFADLALAAGAGLASLVLAKTFTAKAR